MKNMSVEYMENCMAIFLNATSIVDMVFYEIVNVNTTHWKWV